MNLKEDVAQAISDSLPILTPDEIVDEVTDAVWEVLQDKVGAVQEKLMNDLEMARQEARSATNREEAYVETVKNLNAEISSLRAQVREHM